MKPGEYKILRAGTQVTFSGANAFGMYALAGEYRFPTIEATLTFIGMFAGGAGNGVVILANGDRRPVGRAAIADQGEGGDR